MKNEDDYALQKAVIVFFLTLTFVGVAIALSVIAPYNRVALSIAVLAAWAVLFVGFVFWMEDRRRRRRRR